MVFWVFLDVFGNFGKITTFGKTTSPSKNTFLDGYMYNMVVMWILLSLYVQIWLYYVDINVYKPPILIATYLVIDVVADKAA